MGHDPAQDFNDRLIAHMASTRSAPPADQATRCPLRAHPPFPDRTRHSRSPEIGIGRAPAVNSSPFMSTSAPRSDGRRPTNFARSPSRPTSRPMPPAPSSCRFGAHARHLRRDDRAQRADVDEAAGRDGRLAHRRILDAALLHARRESSATSPAARSTAAPSKSSASSAARCAP